MVFCNACSHQQWLSCDDNTNNATIKGRAAAKFSQHTVRGHMWRQHQSMPVVRLKRNRVAMCFLMMGCRGWWPRWTRWWCWTALCGFPPRCSAPLWGVGSRSLKLGSSWPRCPTQSWFLWGSAARCFELWIVTSLDEVWSLRWPPGLWKHGSAGCMFSGLSVEWREWWWYLWRWQRSWLQNSEWGFALWTLWWRLCL